MKRIDRRNLIRSGYAGYQIDDAHLNAIDGKAVDEKSSPIPTKWILEGGGNSGYNGPQPEPFFRNREHNRDNNNKGGSNNNHNSNNSD